MKGTVKFLDVQNKQNQEIWCKNSPFFSHRRKLELLTKAFVAFKDQRRNV